MEPDRRASLMSKYDHKTESNGSIEKSVNTTTDDFPPTLRGKRILLATESLGPINGVSRTTGSLISYLRANGVEVAVIAPEIKKQGSKKVEFAVPQVQQQPSCPQVNVRLAGWPLPYNPDLSIVYPFRLDKLFTRTFVPDLIYLASPASVGFQILLQSRQMSVGNDEGINSPPVICNFQTDLSAYGEIIFPSPMDKYAVWMLGVVQKYLFNGPRVKTVFYPCGDIRRYLTGTGVEGDKLIHLGRGVDTNSFDPKRRDEEYRKELAPNGEIILICVSRLAPEKGFDFLAKAVMKLADLHIPFKLVIVGGNRNLSVQAEVEAYFAPNIDKVVFTGFLTGTLLARAYASADLFLHCSITETFGLVVLEAMASGLPVVARDQGGPSEIVRQEKTGFLVPPNEMDDFVRKVESLCRDQELRNEFGESARQVALNTTWEKINRRAAGYIDTAIREAEEEKRQERIKAENLSCVVRIPKECAGRIIGSIRERIMILIAVIVISGFWIVACIPLILHGTFVFKAE